MPEGNNQSIAGAGNIGLSGIQGSHVNININHNNNYGLSSAPQPYSQQDPFLSSLRGYTYKQNPLPELYRVNCDREHYLELLRTHNRSHDRHLVYFILACPKQEPLGLIKHFVFDLIEANGSNDTSLKFKREKAEERSISIGTTVGKYTQIEDLRKEWLALFKKEDSDFESFISSGLPEQNLQYAIHAFDAYLDELKRENFESLVSSFLEAFKLKASKGPKCIFFFVINAPDYYQDSDLEPEELSILQYLKDLSNTASNRVLFVESLPRVELRYLNKWIQKVFKGGDDPLHIFIKWAKELYNMEIDGESDFLINMSLIQTFQETIWNHRLLLNDR
jgi:hypothetical protein